MSGAQTPCAICMYLHDNRLLDIPIVSNPHVDHITDILNIATERVHLGKLEFKPLVDFLSGLSSPDLMKVCYHSDCRKSVVNKSKLERAPSIDR